MGTPARRPAAVVPAPPWCTTARQAGKVAAKLTVLTTLTWSDWPWAKSVPAEQTSARSPSSAQAALIMAEHHDDPDMTLAKARLVHLTP